MVGSCIPKPDTYVNWKGCKLKWFHTGRLQTAFWAKYDKNGYIKIATLKDIEWVALIFPKATKGGMGFWLQKSGELSSHHSDAITFATPQEAALFAERIHNCLYLG